MAARFFSMVLILGLAAMTASSVTLRSPGRTHAAAAPGAAPLRAFGGRSLQQRRSGTAAKLDGTLAQLERRAALAKPGSLLADLHSLSPAARFKLAADGATPLVAIDAVTRGDPKQLKTALQQLGMQGIAVFANDVGGWLPVAQLEAAGARAELLSMRAALSRTRSGAVTSQGDFVLKSAALRSANGLTGSGVTVGVLSDSFNCYAVYAQAGSGVPVSGYAGYAFNGFTATYATDQGTGDLPADVDVVQEADCLDYGYPLQPPFGDEGRAMLQIVHDVAPSAGLAFYTAEGSEADFAAGIGKLAAAGATVIADDVGYFDEPFFQDGIVAQAVSAVEAPTSGQPVAYFSAAGNEGDASYENLAPSFATAGSGANSGELLLNFDASGATTTTSLPITLDAVQPGQLAAIVVEWDQPYVTGAKNSGGATSRIDVCVTGATGYTIEDDEGNVVTCTGANAAGVDPVQVLILANPASATTSTSQQTVNLVIGLMSGTTVPGRIKVVVETDGQTDAPITTFATHSATVQGHPGAAGAAAVGAAFYYETPACGTTPAAIESFSSQGGTPILFDVTGARLSTPTVRQKPDFVAADGVNDTFLGFTLADGGITGPDGELPTSVASCQNDPSYPNFFGTSAATPHVAGIAALMLQANSALTPTQIYDALRTTALPMGGASGFNFTSGYGLVQADAAFATLPLAAPTLSLSAASVVAGHSVTISWSSPGSTGCTATGSWSGSLASSGSQTLTPSAAGTDTYTLACSDTGETSPATSATLAVTAAPHSGGGAIDWRELLVLTLLVLAARGRGKHATRERAGVGS